MDNDMKLMESMNIIYQTAEDGLADTVKPRLEKAGADCERILIIDESDKSFLWQMIGWKKPLSRRERGC